MCFFIMWKKSVLIIINFLMWWLSPVSWLIFHVWFLHCSDVSIHILGLLHLNICPDNKYAFREGFQKKDVNFHTFADLFFCTLPFVFYCKFSFHLYPCRCTLWNPTSNQPSRTFRQSWGVLCPSGWWTPRGSRARTGSPSARTWPTTTVARIGG